MNLTHLIYFVLFAFALVWLTWGAYVAIMYMDLKRDQLGWPAKVFGYPWLWFGLVLDATLSIIVGTMLFLDPPREWLLTTRLKRYINTAPSGSWRERLASWLCTHLLDPFDKRGDHC